MSKSSLVPLSKTPGSKDPASSTDAARELLRNFALFVGLSTGKKLVPEKELFDIWASALQDLSPDKIRAAGERLIKSWHYPNLPMPGDVRAQLDDADEKGSELEAANAWQELLAWIDRYYHPDIGVQRGAPELSGPVEHACRAAGGFRWIQRCGEDDLVWARKTFIAAYTNVHQTGEVEHLLSRGEARRILSQITAPPKKQLAGAPVSPPPVDSPGIPRSEVREVLSEVVRPAPGPAPITNEQLAARRERLKSALDTYLSSHNLPPIGDSPAPTAEALLARSGVPTSVRIVACQTERSAQSDAAKTSPSADHQPIDSASPDFPVDAAAERTDFAAEGVPA